MRRWKSTETWLGLAHAVFPHSRLTRAERRELDASVWTDAEPFDFRDEQSPSESVIILPEVEAGKTPRQPSDRS